MILKSSHGHCFAPTQYTGVYLVALKCLSFALERYSFYVMNVYIYIYVA